LRPLGGCKALATIKDDIKDGFGWVGSIGLTDSTDSIGSTTCLACKNAKAVPTLAPSEIKSSSVPQ